MSWLSDTVGFDVGDIKSGISSGLDLFKDYTQTQMQIQGASLQRDMAQAQIDVTRTQSAAQAQIQQMQAQAQLRQAQSIYGGSYAGFGNLDQQLSNMGTILNRGMGSNNLMTYLTIAGVIIAVMQYVKK